MKRIVWIASYPKSGNTWTRLFRHAVDRLRAGPVDSIDINDPAFVRGSLQDNARTQYEAFLPSGWDAADKEEMARARPEVHRRIAAAARGLVSVKTHNALIRVNGYPTITPEVTAHAIYIVRHPYDVAVSVKDHFGAKTLSGAVDQMNFDNYVQPKDGRFVDAPVGSWRQNVMSWLARPDPAITVLRYEDMLSAPEEAFAKVMRAYGEAPDPALIRDALALTSFDRLKAKEQESGFAERSREAEAFFARGRSGAGRELLSRADRKRLARANEQLMKRLGYEA